MPIASVQDLRRIAEAMGQIRGHTIHEVEIRSDCRSLRVKFDDGQILLVSALTDDAGKPRLDVDLLHPHIDDTIPGQLEVVFDEDGD